MERIARALPATDPRVAAWHRLSAIQADRGFAALCATTRPASPGCPRRRFSTERCGNNETHIQSSRAHRVRRSRCDAASRRRRRAHACRPSRRRRRSSAISRRSTRRCPTVDPHPLDRTTALQLSVDAAVVHGSSAAAPERRAVSVGRDVHAGRPTTRRRAPSTAATTGTRPSIRRGRL